MKVVLHSETDLSLTEFELEERMVQKDSPELHFGALQMFAESLALCTAGVMTAYSERILVSTEGLAVRVRWQYADKPYRVGRIDTEIHWPGLPDNRLKAVERAAHYCTIHSTLSQSPELHTSVNGGLA